MKASNIKNSFNKDEGKNDDKKLNKSEIDEFKDLYKKYDSTKQGLSKHDVIHLLKGKKILNDMIKIHHNNRYWKLC